jgi:class 3 adenylate cyclase
MLRAIRELGASQIATATERQVSAPTASEPPSKDTAERRQVTVMFSDLVGSTALSARMDPEDLREIISAYQKCVAETVQRFGGFVAKYMGDGVLVYFGYPQAHEDDAERAVRAGLQLVAAVADLKTTRAPLQTRVGIATGLVVVGDIIGAGEAQERGIVGETPNLAARLQDLAEPNSVVIAESTRKLLGNLFDLEDLGAKDLKGIAGPVRAWAALRASSVESRFEALHTTGLIELVGREEELELLLQRWSKVRTGEGQGGAPTPAGPGPNMPPGPVVLPPPLAHPAILRHALPHTLAHHAVAHHAGAFFVASVLLHFLRMLHHCRVIGIFLSARRYPAADQSECDGRQHENVFCHRNLPMGG